MQNDPAATAGQADRKLVILLNGELIVALLLLYPLLRFALGGVSLLALAVAVVIVAAFGLQIGRVRHVAVFAPIIAGCVIAALYCLLRGSSGNANYFGFLAIYCLVIPLLCSAEIVYTRAAINALLLLFCSLSLAFFLFPQMTMFASEKYIRGLEASLPNAATMVEEGLRGQIALTTERFHAFFLHSNEFGQFIAGLAFILSRVRGPRIGSDAVANALFAGTLMFLALLSGSMSALYAIVIAALLATVSSRLVLLVALGVFVALFVAQMFLAEFAARWLEEGSLYWRFLVAYEIGNRAPFIGFNPDNIGLVGNWPHSIFLDLTFVFGRIGPFLLFAIVTSFSLFAVSAEKGAGILAFFTCAALQPAGAMPSCFFLMAVTIFGGRWLARQSLVSPIAPRTRWAN